MINDRISPRQFIGMMLLFLLGSNFGMGASSFAAQDSWLAVLAAAALAVPMAAVYAGISGTAQGENFFTSLSGAAGRIPGKIFTAVFVIFSLHLGAVILRTISEFIEISNMHETPQLIIIAVTALLSAWLVRSGVEAMGRVAKLLAAVLLVSVALTLLLSAGEADLSNLSPVIGTQPRVFADAVSTDLMTPMCEIFLFSALAPYLNSGGRRVRLFVSGLMAGALVLVCVCLRNLLVLGMPSLTMYYYPSYQAVGVLSAGEFFSRFEVLIGMNLLLAGFIKAAVCLFFACEGLSSLTGARRSAFAGPVCALTAALSLMLFRSSMDISNWIRLAKYFSFPFIVVLPLVIFALKKAAAGKVSKSGSPPGM